MISGNGVYDLQEFIHDELRYEHGKSVTREFVQQFTIKLLGKIEEIEKEQTEAYFDARNKKLEEKMSQNK